MYKPPLDFLSIHYAYIIFMSLIGLVVLYYHGNLTVTDAFFFGASASTGTGLDTVDVKDLTTYQQLYLYIIPILTSVGFINIVILAVRLHRLQRPINEYETISRPRSAIIKEAGTSATQITEGFAAAMKKTPTDITYARHFSTTRLWQPATNIGKISFDDEDNVPKRTKHVSFAEEPVLGAGGRTLHEPFHRKDSQDCHKSDECRKLDQRTPATRRSAVAPIQHNVAYPSRSRKVVITEIEKFDFAIKHTRPRLNVRLPPQERISETTPLLAAYPTAKVTLPRSYLDLQTTHNRRGLEGVEYRAAKLLFNVVVLYTAGLHIIGAICLLLWIPHASPKYTDNIKGCGQSSIWWAIFTAQSLVNNLGFTLTPDSMISFKDAPYLMIVMSIIGYAGNTLYPCILRLILWTMSKVSPRHSTLRELLDHLLKQPSGTTFLFPNKSTWVLFGTLCALNLYDVVLILVLDVNHDEVSQLSAGPRLAATIFQAASIRTTGTSSFSISKLHPAVQFSLLIMMYTAIYPIAIAIRTSVPCTNAQRKSAKEVHINGPNVASSKSKAGFSVLAYVHDQLAADLWLILLATFAICVAEADRVMDPAQPSFDIFPVLFEVVSAYGNIGLSLSYPTAQTSFCGHFSAFSKLIICVLMIRGRHRGLSERLDGERADVDNSHACGLKGSNGEMMERPV